MKENEILKFSNPKIAFEKAKRYLGNNAVIKLSTNSKKKYMVFNPNTNKWIHFGQMGYEDFTLLQQKDPVGGKIRRQNYLTRTANMRGNWKDDKYSPNNLSRNILW